VPRTAFILIVMFPTVGKEAISVAICASMCLSVCLSVRPSRT